MYQTSTAFVQQMDTRPFRVVVSGDQGTLELDTLEYNTGWCPTAFSLGNANAANFSGQVNAPRLPFGAGERVALSARLSLADGGEEAVPLGCFVLTRVERQADTERWTLAGEDALSTLLAEEYFCTDVSNPPTTAAQVLAEICAHTGLTLAEGALVAQADLALEYDAAGGSGTSMRELVGQIAQLSGANALLDRQGALRLCRLTDTGFQLGPQRYYESGLSLEGEDFVFGALEVTVPTTQTGEAGTQESQQVYSAQLEGVTRGVSFTSPWFDQTLFDGVWQAWQGQRWRPAQIEFLGDLRLDPGDRITITDRAGADYTLVVMALKHSFDGGFRTTVSSFGPGETGSVQPQTVSQAITGLKTDLGRFRRLYTDNLEATAAQIKHITTEDIVGQCGTINLAKGTFQFGDALVWDGDQLTVRGKLESGDGTVGGWGIRPDCLETSYASEDGTTGWEGYTRLVPASWAMGESDAGLLLRAAKTGTGSEESEGWMVFHRAAESQWAYQNLKLGASVLGGAPVSADRYLTTSEIVLGQITGDGQALDHYGIKLSADNGVGVATTLTLTPGGDVTISGGNLQVGGARVVTEAKMTVTNNLGTLVASYDGQSTVFFDFNITPQMIIRLAFDNSGVRQLFTPDGGQSWQTVWSK